MKKTAFLILIFSIFLLIFTFSSQVQAAEETNAIKLESPIEATSVPELIGNVIRVILTVIGAVALGMFVYGGFTWMTSGGNAEAVKKGKDIIVWSIVGLGVILASYALVDLIIMALAG